MPMKTIADYLDATFLKTEKEGLTKEEIQSHIDQLIQDAVKLNVKLIMISPEYVFYAKTSFQQLKSKVGVGTVIDFPMGAGGVEHKLYEAQIAINNNVDELDFVIDYKAFQKGFIDQVKDEVYQCTQLALAHHKIAKWIIETAALTDNEIIRITALIKNVVLSNFDEKNYDKVFVKSSTGFYPTKDGSANGANRHVITLMLENATPLPIKASGGIRTKEDLLLMISLGVKRVGTSSHVQLLKELGF